VNTLETGGTWGHSTVVGGNSYFISSSYNPTGLLAFLQEHGIGHKEVRGKWRDEEERAFVINMNDLKKVYASGWISQEECILVLGPCEARDRRPASLHGVKNATWSYDAGLFYQITREEAMNADGWMFDPTQQAYFGMTNPPHLGGMEDGPEEPARYSRVSLLTAI
jgi:hypothetical protein